MPPPSELPRGVGCRVTFAHPRHRLIFFSHLTTRAVPRLVGRLLETGEPLHVPPNRRSTRQPRLRRHSDPVLRRPAPNRSPRPVPLSLSESNREHDHDDAVAEAVALAWKWFVRLVQQGKHPEEFVSAIAAFAARAVKGGRRLCGQEKANDVLSRQTQARRGFLVSRFPEFSTLTGNALEEALHDNATTPVPDQVSFRLDFPAWLATRSSRDRELIGELIAGERNQDTARRFGISPSRISQLRLAYLADWRLFCDEPV